jgi:hypothetical protein
MVGCRGNNEAREDTVAQRQHDLTMRRFAGWWRRTRINRFKSRSSARRSAYRNGPCGCVAGAVEGWAKALPTVPPGIWGGEYQVPIR